MSMEIQGYCMLKSTNTVIGYAGERADLLPPNILKILDIAVDGNGFLVLNGKGNALAMVEKSDVSLYFLCNVFCGFICPPNMNLFEKMAFAQGRIERKGGYTNRVASIVIAASLIRGEFTDSFLFQE